MHQVAQPDLFEEAKRLFIRYGSAASEAMFDFPCKFFQIPGCKGIIAYRIAHECAIVFGDPICPPEELACLAEAFYTHCRERNLNLIYVIVSKKFADMVDNHGCSISMEVCEECLIDPEFDPCHASSRMRHRVNHALKHGLTMHEYIPFDPIVENRLKEIGSEWQKAIKGPNIYLGHLDFFQDYTGKRWFYVKDGESITSMAMLSKLEAKDGWLLKFLITSPEAIPDTSEFLMTSLLGTLKNENCRFLSKGMMPTTTLKDIRGLGLVATYASKHVYQVIGRIFKFAKRKEYWLRYNPRSEPAYLLLSSPRIGIQEIRALMKIFRSSYTTH